MYKKYLPYLITAVVSLLLALKYYPPFAMFFDDKEIFEYAGLALKKGMVPYRDFFDHKPPLIFFWNYAAQYFGDNGLWILDTCLVLYASIVFLRLNLRYQLPLPYILPILFNLVLRHPQLSFGNGMTREYTTIFFLLLFCVVLSNARFKYLQVGVFCALIFFMQQDQLLLAFPIVLYALNQEKQIQTWRKLMIVFVGALVVTLPIVLYFAFNNALDDFWRDAFLFNFNWYTAPEHKPGLVQEVVTIKNKLLHFHLAVLLLLTCILAATALWMGSKARELLIIVLLCLPLSFTSELLSGKMSQANALVNYYLLPLAATLPIVLFVTFAFSQKAIFKNKILQLVLAGLLLFGPMVAIASHSVNFYRYPQDYINSSAEIKYLDKNRPGNNDLYVFNNPNYIFAYNKYEIVAPSKWVYHHFWNWYASWDADHSITRSIIADLQKHQTQYIINFCEGKDAENNQNFRIWRMFLDSSYTQLHPLKLWKRNADFRGIEQYILPLSKH